MMPIDRFTFYLLLTLVFLRSASSQELDLPLRETAIPQTTNNVPHVQIGITPDLKLSETLLVKVAQLPSVEIRETVISLPGAKGFWIKNDIALARPEVIVGGREFAHLHPDGSLHAALAPELAKEATQKGWAIPHPWSTQKKGWDGFVMIFTPQNLDELNVVYQLVEQSYSYVTGRELQDQ